MLRKPIIAMFVGAAVLSATASARAANCEQVQKYAGLGRTADDISETMVVPLDEVKKCLAGGGKAPPAQGEAGGGAKAGEAGAEGQGGQEAK